MPSDRFRFLRCSLHPVTDVASSDILETLGWAGCDVHPTGAETVPVEFTLSADPPGGHIDLTDPLGWAFAVQALYQIRRERVGAKAAPSSSSVVFRPILRKGRNPRYGWQLKVMDDYPGMYDQTRSYVFFPPNAPLDIVEDFGWAILIPTTGLPRHPAKWVPEKARHARIRREALCRCFAAVLGINVDETWPPLPADPAEVKGEE